MYSRVEELLVKLVRIVAGFCFIFLGKEFTEAGLSKYAPQGAARPLHWGEFLAGLAVMFAGATLVRPYWWRQLSRRRH